MDVSCFVNSSSVSELFSKTVSGLSVVNSGIPPFSRGDTFTVRRNAIARFVNNEAAISREILDPSSPAFPPVHGNNARIGRRILFCTCAIGRPIAP